MALQDFDFTHSTENFHFTDRNQVVKLNFVDMVPKNKLFRVTHFRLVNTFFCMENRALNNFY